MIFAPRRRSPDASASRLVTGAELEPPRRQGLALGGCAPGAKLDTVLRMRTFLIATLCSVLISSGCSDDSASIDSTDPGVDSSASDALLLDTGAADGSGSTDTAADTAVADTGSGSDVSVGKDAASPDSAGPSPFKVVVTELLMNPKAVSDTAGEWLEIYNAGTAPVDLSGWTLADDGSDSHKITTSVTVAPGAYAVLARDKSTTSNGGVTAVYQYAKYYLGNSGDEVVLKDKNGLLVDRVAYTSSWAITNGASLQLKATGLDNNVAANWCVAKNAWSGSAGDKGTPGAPNDCAGSSTDGGPSGDAVPVLDSGVGPTGDASPGLD